MKKWLRIIGVLAALGIIAAILVYVFVYNKPHRNYEKAKADYTLDASALYSAYTGNKEEANQKYNAKVLQINGMLNKIEEADSLVIAVFVFNQGMFGDEGIRCTLLPKFNQRLKSTGLNTKITLKGLCTGFNDTDIILEKCSIQ
jgi:type II secretory pathway pseudopilin PulG